MQTKLTLRLDARLIRQAKAYAHRSGKSVSAVVADFFASLGTGGRDVSADELSPTVRRLLGALEDSSVREQDYRRYLEKKHR